MNIVIIGRNLKSSEEPVGFVWCDIMKWITFKGEFEFFRVDYPTFPSPNAAKDKIEIIATMQYPDRDFKPVSVNPTTSEITYPYLIVDTTREDSIPRIYIKSIPLVKDKQFVSGEYIGTLKFPLFYEGLEFETVVVQDFGMFPEALLNYPWMSALVNLVENPCVETFNSVQQLVYTHLEYWIP